MSKERKELLELAERIKSNEFRVFVPEKEDCLWIIFAHKGERIFYTEGISVSLKYKPSRENGDSCVVAEHLLSDSNKTLDTLKHSPLDKLCFIPLKELKLYKNIEEYLKEESWIKYREL